MNFSVNVGNGIHRGVEDLLQLLLGDVQIVRVDLCQDLSSDTLQVGCVG